MSSKGLEYTAAGAFTFNVPTGVTSLRVTMLGGGGSGVGGATDTTGGGGGGGAGESVIALPYNVTGLGSVSGLVGAGGIGGDATVAVAGGNTTFGNLLVRGGAAVATPAQGGGAGGGAGGSPGQSNNNPGLVGTKEAARHFGGSSGGGHFAAGGGAASYPLGGASSVVNTGGGGGASTLLGVGAAGAILDADGTFASSAGTGGGGAGGVLTRLPRGGNGAPGYVQLQWVGGDSPAVITDASFGSVQLLLHMNGSTGSVVFTDVKGHTVTASGNAQISTAQSKFGGASGLFDGTGDYLTVTNSSDFNMPDNGGTTGSPNVTPFTWETWTYFASGSNVKSPLTIGLDTTYGTSHIYSIWRDSDNKLKLLRQINGTGIYRITGATTVTQNAWHHVAWVREANNGHTMFLDGVKEGSQYFPLNGSGINSDFALTPIKITLGAFFDGATYSLSLDGNLDEFRFTNGVCRYPGGTTFTPVGPFLDA